MVKSTTAFSIACSLIIFVFVIGFIAQLLVNRPEILTFFYKSQSQTPKVYATSYVQPVGGSASGYT